MALNGAYRQKVNKWWKDGRGKMDEARADARNDAHLVWQQYVQKT